MISLRTRSELIYWLSLACLVLLLASLIKDHVLTLESLRSNKDALAAVNSLVTSIAVLVGGLFSYFRFFRGRTFSLHGQLDVSVTAVEAPDGGALHAVTLKMQNVGAATIWEPRPCLSYKDHSALGTSKELPFEVQDPLTGFEPRIEPGETATFFAEHRLGPSVWAVTYIAGVTCRSGDMWKRIIAVKAVGESEDTRRESRPQ